MTTGIVACGAPQKPAAPEREIVVRVDRMFPKADGLDASKVAIRLEVNNPQSGPVTITEIDYEISTDIVDGPIRGTVPSGGTIESNQKAGVEFEQSIPFPDDEAAYLNVLKKGMIPLALKGQVKLSDGRSLPFERNGAVATPSLPKFIVYDAQAARYEAAGLDVTFFLRLINENVFSVTIGGVEYTIFIDGDEMRSEQGAIGVNLIQGAAQEFEVSIVLSEKTYPKAKQLIASGEVEYRVVGKVSMDRLEIPFDHTGKLTLGTSEE